MVRRLAELAWVFLRLGLTSFGGPAAHLALFREQLVRRRAWLSDAEYLDLIGAANLIPGPNSTEVAIHTGYRRAGWAGMLVAGSAFILPAFVIVLVLAWVYVVTAGRPEVKAVFAGIAPVVVAIVAHSGAGLLRTAARTVLLGAIVAGALVGALAGVGEIPLLAGGGLVSLAVRGVRRVDAPSHRPFASYSMRPAPGIQGRLTGLDGTATIGPSDLPRSERGCRPASPA